MEKEGLVRTLELKKKRGLEVSVLVTDRYRQIAKFVREVHSDIMHYYNVWHLVKGKVLTSVNLTSLLAPTMNVILALPPLH